MSNPLDAEAGSELFSSYEAELKLVQADLTQKLDQIPEMSGESRKSAVVQAERALEEADELVPLSSPRDSAMPSQANLDLYHCSWTRCVWRNRISRLRLARR